MWPALDLGNRAYLAVQLLWSKARFQITFGEIQAQADEGVGQGAKTGSFARGRVIFAEFESLILLMRTLSDFDYQPKTSTGALVQRSSKAGEGPTTTRLCSRAGCKDGRIRVRGIERFCESCRGTGVEIVDAYTESRVETEEQRGDKTQRMVRCDECGGSGKSVWWRLGEDLTNTCRRCWGAKLVPAPRHPIRPWRTSPRTSAVLEVSGGDPIVTCMVRRQEEGSYDELALALTLLRLEQRSRYRLVVGTFVLAEREVDDLRIEEALETGFGLRFVRHRMPEEIRVPSWAAQFEKRRRERVESEKAAA